MVATSAKSTPPAAMTPNCEKPRKSKSASEANAAIVVNAAVRNALHRPGTATTTASAGESGVPPGPPDARSSV